MQKLSYTVGTCKESRHMNMLYSCWKMICRYHCAIVHQPILREPKLNPGLDASQVSESLS